MLIPPYTNNPDLDSFLYDLSLNINNATDSSSGATSGLTTDTTTGEIKDSDGNIVGYLYQYIHIKYANSNTGLDLSDSPTSKSFYGIRNSDSITESTNPADYTWFSVPGTFGTTRRLYYSVLGGRKIKFDVNTAPIDYKWLLDGTAAVSLDNIVPTKTISTNEIMDAAVTNLKLAEAAVSASKLNVAAISSTTGNLVENSVGPTQITDGAVTTEKITANAITSGKIAANAITSVKIEAGAITSDKINVGTLSAITANLGTVTAGTLFSNLIQSASSNFEIKLGTSATVPSAGTTWQVGGYYRRTGSGGSVGPALVIEDSSSTPTTYAASLYSANGGVAKFESANNTNGTNVVWVTGTDANGSGILASGTFGLATINAVNLGDGPAISATGGVTAIASGFKGFAVSAVNSNTASTSVGSYSRGYHGIRAQNPTATSSALIALNDSRCFYNEAGTFGPFTGAHDALIPITSDVVAGDLVEDIDLVTKKGWNDSLHTVAKTTTPNSRSVVGVVSADPLNLSLDFIPASLIKNFEESATGQLLPIPVDNYADLCANYKLVVVNAVGEGVIQVCNENGNIQKGDLLVSSSTAGVAMKQTDDIIRSPSVAKAREAVIFTTNDIQTVSCMYLSG
jgi:hypothetical protein